MKKIALSILSAAVLVGCVDARHVQDPQGKDYLHIKCSSLNTMKPVTAKCQARATKECPGGYLVIHNAMSPFSNENSMILSCDRNPEDAAKNFSRYTAFGSALNVDSATPYRGTYADLKINSSEIPAAAPQNVTTETAVTTDKEVVANKNGQKETVTKTTKVSKKEKKANH
ncbi:hypothetical protein FAI41_04900 [Acetobacteraceae bacterium]|nr:hypothetical protein FAI41_04900 [Acetobacteraceae bacterium]